MNSVVAVILAKERRMVSRFVAAGATSRDRARSLDQIGVARGVILRRLRERAVVRQAGQDLYYVDAESWAAVRRTRRRAASVLVIIGLVIVFAVLWSRRAQAVVPIIDAAEEGERNTPHGRTEDERKQGQRQWLFEKDPRPEAPAGR